MDDADPPFRVTTDPATPSRLVAEGELDATTAPALSAALASATSASGDDLWLDLERVTFIDSSGLQAITAALRGLREQGRDLRVAGASRPVRRIFEVTGLRGLLPTD